VERTAGVACQAPGCTIEVVTIVGVGPRRFGRQRLDALNLVCAAHAPRIRGRRLFEISLKQWLKSDLDPFHRWHRPSDLANYIRQLAP